MLDLSPGQLYFLGLQTAARLATAGKLGLRGSEELYELLLKTVQFHAETSARLREHAAGVRDAEALKKFWGDLFDTLRESIAHGAQAQRGALQLALDTSQALFAAATEVPHRAACEG
jgi:hypothetical protein